MEDSFSLLRFVEGIGDFECFEWVVDKFEDWFDTILDKNLLFSLVIVVLGHNIVFRLVLEV